MAQEQTSCPNPPHRSPMTETELVETTIHLARYAGRTKAMSAMTVAKQVFGE